MIVALAFAIVLLVGFIIYTVYGAKSKPVVAPSKTTSRPSAASSSGDEEEATRVRVAGPRLIRTMGGLKVGDEMPINGFLTIGRGGNSTIRFNDAEMSTNHAEFRVEADKAMVIDLGSTNGTFLNSKKLDANQATPLSDGDQIKVGSTVFVFKQFQ